MSIRIVLTLLTLVVAVGCASNSNPPSQDVRAAAVFDAYYQRQLELNPIGATFRGDGRYNDQLPNLFGPDHRRKQLANETQALNAIQALDRGSLSPSSQLSYDIFVRQRREAIRSFDFPGWQIPINQFYAITNTLAQLGSGSSAQPFKTVTDYENWLSRLAQIPPLIDQIIINMREGIADEVTLPATLVQRIIPQLEAHLVGSVEESLFYQPIKNMPPALSAAQRTQLEGQYQRAISGQLITSYGKLRDFLADEYLPKARTTDGLGSLPGGRDWYAFNVARTTTTDMTPEQIHRVGLDEVARIQAEMRGVMATVGFTGSLQEFFEYTKTDPQFVFSSADELLAAYRETQARVDPGTKRLFALFPRADYEVRAVEPFREKSASAGSYQSAPEDGSRPGIFYVNTYDLSARPTWAVESLFLHEAAPGHHFQIGIQQELEGVPKFRRFGRSTAYVEGWALYAESLGKELGVYTDPYQYYGALAAELWRAIRLVVDTGLHAKGWSREQVLEYMYANSPAAEARAVSEAERYMALPGQALAYKIGQLKIRELRHRAEQQLGPGFDLTVFHTKVLEDGAIPLNLLEQKIDHWIQQH